MKGYILGQASLFGHDEFLGFGSDEFLVKTMDRDQANEMIKNNHYSGKIYMASHEHHGVYINGALVGVLQWGPGMNPGSGGSVVSGTQSGEWLELNRMWLDDVAPRNSESRAIAYSVKLIKKRLPKVQWLQSFADERCGGLGVVYQACSFLYLGEHDSIFWELDGDWYHNIAATVKGEELACRPGAVHLQANIDRATKHVFRQFRYWRGLSTQARKNLNYKPIPYVKRETPCHLT